MVKQFKEYFNKFINTEKRTRKQETKMCYPFYSGTSFFVTFSAILCLSHDLPVVSVGGNWITQRKQLPNLNSQATFFTGHSLSQDLKPGSGE